MNRSLHWTEHNDENPGVGEDLAVVHVPLPCSRSLVRSFNASTTAVIIGPRESLSIGLLSATRMGVINGDFPLVLVFMAAETIVRTTDALRRYYFSCDGEDFRGHNGFI